MLNRIVRRIRTDVLLSGSADWSHTPVTEQEEGLTRPITHGLEDGVVTAGGCGMAQDGTARPKALETTVLLRHYAAFYLPSRAAGPAGAVEVILTGLPRRSCMRHLSLWACAPGTFNNNNASWNFQQ